MRQISPPLTTLNSIHLDFSTLDFGHSRTYCLSGLSYKIKQDLKHRFRLGSSCRSEVESWLGYYVPFKTILSYLVNQVKSTSSILLWHFAICSPICHCKTKSVDCLVSGQLFILIIQTGQCWISPQFCDIQMMVWNCS